MAEKTSKEGETKSSKKWLIIIVLIILLLGGGGAGYYFLVLNKADEVSTEHKSDQQEKAAKPEEAEHPVVEPDVYYEMSSPLLVNYPAGSSARIIKISVSIQAKGDASVEALKKHEPMIRNNLLMAISAIGADKAKTLEGKKELQASMLSEVGKVLEKMAGKNSVKDVYFTEFVMQ